MDTFIYQDSIINSCPIGDLISYYSSKPKDLDKIKAIINHVFNGYKGLNSKFVELCRGGKCHDGKSIYELKIQLSKILIRIFFVPLENHAIMFDWLEKRHKPDYGKSESNKVDKKYLEKIENTRVFYKKCLINNAYLKKVKF